MLKRRTASAGFFSQSGTIKELEQRLKIIASQYSNHQQLMMIPGIGLITATALIASIGNASCFENGRQLSAWLGLVPRQHSSGGKNKGFVASINHTTSRLLKLRFWTL